MNHRRREFLHWSLAGAALSSATATAADPASTLRPRRLRPGEGFGSLTLDEIFDDYTAPLNVPVYRGAAIGPIKRKMTISVGALAEIDAGAGTLRLLQSAVL